MRQRVVLALALCAEPELVIADEPTTALDVSVQAQIIMLIKRLCAERGTAVMLITHDMGVIAETADRVAVMYAGRVAEIGPVREVVQRPFHPYSRGLMGVYPDPGGRGRQAGADPRFHAATGRDAARLRLPPAMPALPLQGVISNVRSLSPAGNTRSHASCTRKGWSTKSGGDAAPSLNSGDPSASRVSGDLDPGRSRSARIGPTRAGNGHVGVMTELLVQVSGLKRVFDVSRPWLDRVIAREGRQC